MNEQTRLGIEAMLRDLVPGESIVSNDHRDRRTPEDDKLPTGALDVSVQGKSEVEEARLPRPCGHGFLHGAHGALKKSEADSH